jgi:hypothetical protein
MKRRTALSIALVLLSACGGGGGNPGPGPGPAPVVLLPSARYFPSESGAAYRYGMSALLEPLPPFPVLPDNIYIVEPNPLGAGQYYNVQEDQPGELGFPTRGPVFEGLRFTGLVEDKTGAAVQRFVTGAGDQADVLPPVLTGIGQSWPIDVRLGAGGTPFISKFHITGAATLAAVEDVTLGATVFEDCVRVDVALDYSYLNQPIPGLTGSYWLAPDVGPVQGVCRSLGVELGRVTLTGISLP